MSIPQDIPTSKRCTRCGEEKPLDLYQKRASSPDGHAWHCKACQSAYDHARKEQKRNYARERVAADPVLRAKRNAYKRNRYATDEEYREKYKKDVVQWQQGHREQVNASHRRRHPVYRLTDAYRDNKRKKKYNRRALMKNKGTFTEREWRDLCAFYDHRCLRCGRQFPLEELTRDHVVPVTKPGGYNTIKNIQPLCMECNQEKSDRTMDFRTIEQLRMEWDE